MPKRVDTLADLTPDAKNANRGTERGRAMLEASLRQYGAGRSVLADKHGALIAGNKTVEVAADLGIPIRTIETDGRELVVVQRTDLDLAEGGAARELAYADNRVSQVSLEWELAQIGADVEAGLDLSALWSEDELAALLAGLDAPTEGLTDPDAVPPLPAEPITQPGDMWICGKHRILCGDSTVATDVERLWGNERADIIWTDPPYGVNYVGKTADAMTLQNDDAGGLEGLLCGAFTRASEVTKPGAPFYVAHPPGALHLVFWLAAKAVGWQIHQELVWVKDSMVLGHSDYHFQHEPILYGWLPGPGRSGRGNHEGSRWHGDHSQVSVFAIPRPKASPDHPTGKPVELIAAHLENSSAPGGVIYDPFLGSGTTLIAAEQLGRACYGMEISPAYCDVIVARWEAFTGGKAVRDGE